jgi:hypothetical protein
MYYWPENYTFECRVELPRVMMFTHPKHNRIRIDRLSKLTSQGFTYKIVDRYNHYVSFISWFNIAEGSFIGMGFAKTGSLESIQIYKYEENRGFYDQIIFNKVKGENCTYFNENNNLEFTTMIAFYSINPYNHYPSKLDDYKIFLNPNHYPQRNKLLFLKKKIKLFLKLERKSKRR